MRKYLFMALGYIVGAVLIFSTNYIWYGIGYKRGYKDCIVEFQEEVDKLKELHGELVRFYDKAKEANKD